jgi:hypothetical protein
MKRARTKKFEAQVNRREDYIIVTAAVHKHEGRYVFFNRLSESVLRGERQFLSQKFKMKEGKFPTLCHYSKTNNQIYFGDSTEVFRSKVSWKRGKVYVLLARTVLDRDGHHFVVAFTTFKHYSLLIAREVNPAFWARVKAQQHSDLAKAA